MGRTENAELTMLCLIENGSRILLQNRVKKDWRGYALPGGHVEPGESFVDAVIREMKEETGLTEAGRDQTVSDRKRQVCRAAVQGGSVVRRSHLFG